MVKTNSVIVHSLFNGTYFTSFSHMGTLVQGIVPEDLIPEDYEELEIFQLEDYFDDWQYYIQKNIPVEIKREQIKKEISRGKVTDLLTEKDNLYYRLNGTVSLPEELVLEYSDHENDPAKIAALDKFWYWSCQLAHEQKEMLFGWIKRNDFQLTNDGLIIGYRNVVPLSESFVNNVTASFKKVKKMKKNVKSYKVNSDGIIAREGMNLHDLYSNINNTFTHDYLAAKRSYYTLGKEASLKKEEVSYMNIPCSSGLKYVVSY